MRWRPSRPGSSSRTPSSTTTWRRSHSIRTTPSPTRSGRARESPTPAAADARPAWASTSRPTAASRGRARSGSRSSPAEPWDRSPCSPATRDVVFAASGRGVLGVTNTCCGGVDALIPGAPHFGLYRSLDGGGSWQLVSQGAADLCTSSTPDQVALNQTPCSPRGARRVMFDPSTQTRSTCRSSRAASGARAISATPGSRSCRASARRRAPPSAPSSTWSHCRAVRHGCTWASAAAVLFARFRRNDAVRDTAAAAAAASWVDLTSNNVANAAGYSSFGYCDGQCSYDNYVYVPPGAGPDTVYLLGDYEYNENNYVSGRSNGRGILLSTNAGVHFTDMTEDASDDVLSGAGASGSPRPGDQSAELAAVLRPGRRRRSSGRTACS